MATQHSVHPLRQAGGSLRTPFGQFAWLEVGSDKAAFSQLRPPVPLKGHNVSRWAACGRYRIKFVLHSRGVVHGK